MLYEQGLPCPSTAFTFFRDDPGRTVEEIVKARDDLGLALARNFYPFRKPVVDRIITSMARENGHVRGGQRAAQRSAQRVGTARGRSASSLRIRLSSP